MNFYIISLFPKFFKSPFETSILARAQKRGQLKINFIDPRSFTYDKHKTVDDKPYGGGAGMVLRVDVLVTSIESISPKPYIILLSASGKKYDQKMALDLSKKPNVALICGHYEGIDARVEKFVDDVVSIGDFVLTGGEIAAMAIVDSVTRLIPGVIHLESPKSESFSPLTINNKQLTSLEYPQYTRPEIFRNLKVPSLLLEGNHAQIAKWRTVEALNRTKKFRPDLLKS